LENSYHTEQVSINGSSVTDKEFFGLTTLLDTAKEGFKRMYFAIRMPVHEAKKFKFLPYYLGKKGSILPTLIQSIVPHVSFLGDGPKYFGPDTLYIFGSHKIKSFQVGIMNLLPLSGGKKVGGEGLFFNRLCLCIKLHEVSLVDYFS
jgi:hypothetical protein